MNWSDQLSFQASWLQVAFQEHWNVLRVHHVNSVALFNKGMLIKMASYNLYDIKYYLYGINSFLSCLLFTFDLIFKYSNSSIVLLQYYLTLASNVLKMKPRLPFLWRLFLHHQLTKFGAAVSETTVNWGTNSEITIFPKITISQSNQNLHHFTSNKKT